MQQVDFVINIGGHVFVESSHRSFKKTFLQAASGGRIGSSNTGIIEVEALKKIDFTLTEG
ncbi:hypothetical protein ONJ45_25795, partial [Salmonella enterica subsp. enterica serovar Virginia]|nr:hypothetical protein [Salmonella enterica subsp. enterica serovar Virginia]